MKYKKNINIFNKKISFILVVLLIFSFQSIAQDTILLKNKYFSRIVVFGEDSIIGFSKSYIYLIINKRKIKKIGSIRKGYILKVKKHPFKTVVFADIELNKIEVFDYSKQKKINSINFPDKKRISLLDVYATNGICYLWLSDSEGKIYLFNYESQKIEKEWKVHDNPILESDIKDSLMITTSINEQKIRTKVVLWNTKTQTIIKQIDFSVIAPLCRISPNCNFFSLSYYDDYIYIWETKNYSQVLQIPIPYNKKNKYNFFSHLSFSPNEKYIIIIERSNHITIEFNLDSMLRNNYDKKYVTISKNNDISMWDIIFSNSLKKKTILFAGKIIIFNIDIKYID